MLKQRLATAVVLILLVVLALFALPPAGVALILGAFVLLGAWEWAVLSGLRGRAPRALYVLGMLAAMSVAYFLPILPMVVAGSAWWVLAFYALLRAERAGVAAVLNSVWGRAVSGLFILLPAWRAAVYLHAADPRSPAILLFLFTVVWVADSGAFFVGRAFGRTKLAPAISPGKSVEGLLGGLAAVALLALAGGVWVWQLPAAQLWLFCAIAVITALFSALGDLVESKAKRIAGVKDSGVLLPGHGGVMDRIDAFTAAAPVFALGWLSLFRLTSLSA